MTTSTRLLVRAAWLSAVAVLAASASARPNTVVDLPITPNPNEVTHPWLFGNAVWTTPIYTLRPHTDPPIVIEAQETLTVNFVFTDGIRIRVTDGSGDESIHFSILGTGVDGLRFMRYRWWFTGLAGSLPHEGTGPNNPITGTCPISPSGNVTFDRDDLALVNGTFSFSDIHLEIMPTNTLTPWTITGVGIGYDGDTITVVTPPAPGPAALLALALVAAGGRRSRARG